MDSMQDTRQDEVALARSLLGRADYPISPGFPATARFGGSKFITKDPR
jgi:hypothetical protein